MDAKGYDEIGRVLIKLMVGAVVVFVIGFLIGLLT